MVQLIFRRIVPPVSYNTTPEKQMHLKIWNLSTFRSFLQHSTKQTKSVGPHLGSLIGSNHFRTINSPPDRPLPLTLTRKTFCATPPPPPFSTLNRIVRNKITNHYEFCIVRNNVKLQQRTLVPAQRRLTTPPTANEAKSFYWNHATSVSPTYTSSLGVPPNDPRMLIYKLNQYYNLFFAFLLIRELLARHALCWSFWTDNRPNAT